MKNIALTTAGLFCLAASALAFPLVSGTVTTTSESVSYNYHLTNTTPYAIWEFSVYIPGQVADAVAGFTTSQDKWSAGFARRNEEFALIGWHFLSGTAGTSVAPGHAADFGFTILAGVPTTYGFTLPGWDTNWMWYDVSQHDGDTVLPVPIPEPSSLLALAAGIGGLGLGFVRRRRG